MARPDLIKKGRLMNGQSREEDHDSASVWSYEAIKVSLLTMFFFVSPRSHFYTGSF